MSKQQRNITDGILRNAHDIDRAGVRLGRRIIQSLLVAQSSILRKLERDNKATFTRTYQLEVLRDLRKQLNIAFKKFPNLFDEAGRKTINETYRKVNNVLTEEIPEAAALGISPKIPLQSVKTILGKPIAGIALAEGLKDLNNKLTGRVRDQLAQSIIQGEGAVEAARRLRHSFGQTFTESENLARTALNQVGNDTLLKVYRDFDDVIQGYVFTATLDTRTCVTCAGFDGMKAREYSDLPAVPNHWQCRCVIIPLTVFADDGFGRPAVIEYDEKIVKHRDGTTSTLFKPKETRKNQMLTYEEFFERQDDKFKRKVLGKSRFELYKKNDLKIDSFTTATGRIKRLDELPKPKKKAA